MSIDDSFQPGETQTGPKGQLAHPKTLEHSKRLEKKLYKVGKKAWSLIGNGLSNQSFVEGPDGLICIIPERVTKKWLQRLRKLEKKLKLKLLHVFILTFIM